MSERLDIRLGTERDLLGESPVWDDRQQALYWVDTRRRLVHCQQDGQPTQSWTAPQEVGSIALARPGWMLLALEDRFSMLELSSGALHPIAEVQHPKLPMRLNDGRTDKEGRFVCGSMVLGRREPDGELFRLDSDGRVTRLLGGNIVSNATCFSPDGRTLYHADSHSGVIRAWAYARDGSISNERVFVDTRPQGSGPDGATVDAEGCLWVALVLTAKVARYAPDGRLLYALDLPVPYPTCPSFGGPELDTLFVTSIRDSGNALRSEDPRAGALVEIRGLGVRGLPEVPFAGLTAKTT